MKTDQTKTCVQCQASFHITQNDLAFYDKVSPVLNGKKYQIPSPSLCSDCSIQNKFVWRNDKNFYRISIEGSDYISMYRPDTDWNIISSKDWWAQNYTPVSKPYDSSQSFFQQFAEIAKATAHPHMITMDSENCDYTNFNGFCKDCYLCAA